MQLLLVMVMSSLGSIGSTAGAGLLLVLGAWVSRVVPYGDFLEEPDGTVRLGLRSRRGVDVGSLARELGGGGHEEAAGARVQGALDEVVAGVLNRAKKLLPSSRVL